MVAGGRVGGMAVRMGEGVSTYATLDSALYTPTEEKPYRGIWVGDYAGHGCEFLLLHQPDDPPETSSTNSTSSENSESSESSTDGTSSIEDYADLEGQKPNESFESFKARRIKERKIYRGSLEAIKLTGDPNIPRGEHTWVADDIGPAGFVRILKEAGFKGARMVRSRGHIAARGFVNDKWVESQLILISPNRLAQYWIGFGHISYFERVNIDKFLSPYNSSLDETIC